MAHLLGWHQKVLSLNKVKNPMFGV